MPVTSRNIQTGNPHNPRSLRRRERRAHAETSFFSKPLGRFTYPIISGIPEALLLASARSQGARRHPGVRAYGWRHVATPDLLGKSTQFGWEPIVAYNPSTPRHRRWLRVSGYPSYFARPTRVRRAVSWLAGTPIGPRRRRSRVADSPAYVFCSSRHLVVQQPQWTAYDPPIIRSRKRRRRAWAYASATPIAWHPGLRSGNHDMTPFPGEVI